MTDIEGRSEVEVAMERIGQLIGSLQMALGQLERSARRIENRLLSLEAIVFPPDTSEDLDTDSFDRYFEGEEDGYSLARFEALPE